MNSYLIEQKVKTLSMFWEDGLDLSGFEFRQWDFTWADGPFGDAWVVRKIVTGNYAHEALTDFMNELNPLLKRMCFISQCEMHCEHEPFLIYKEMFNEEKVFYLRHSYEIPPVPLSFGDDEVESLNHAMSYSKEEVFEYLQDANNTRNYISRLALLIMALESIAGEISKNKTDMEYIKKEILQDEDLFKELFGHGVGFRNKLFHGKRENAQKNYTDLIYKRIIQYFNRKHDFKLEENIVHPQRTITGNYEAGNLWLKPKDLLFHIDLKNVLEHLMPDHHRIGDSTDPNFDYVAKPPNY